MAFEERLTASFRGVPFLLNTVSGDSGRRALPHEYPKRETGWTEDHGARISNAKISGKLVGESYVQQLNALLAALQQPGPGELVHPWFGTQQVQVGDVTHRLTLNEDCLATVEFTAHEAGDPLYPSATENTAQTMQDDADAALAEANAAFADAVDVSAMDSMMGAVDDMLTDLENFTESLPTIPDELNEFMDEMERAKESVGELLAYPGELASECTTLVEDVNGLCTDPIRALDVYDQVGNRWSGMMADGGSVFASGFSAASGSPLQRSLGESSEQFRMVGSTPSIPYPSMMAAVRRNHRLFAEYVINITLACKAKAIGLSSLTVDTGSRDSRTPAEIIDGLTGWNTAMRLTGYQLRSIGDRLARDLDNRAAIAVDQGNRGLWRALRQLKRTVIRDTRARAAKLPTLQVVALKQTSPSAAVAWRHLGDAAYRSALIRRNGIANPAFFPAGQPIEVVHD